MWANPIFIYIYIVRGLKQPRHVHTPGIFLARSFYIPWYTLDGVHFGLVHRTRLLFRPIAHWWRFKIPRQASTPSVMAGRATNACYNIRTRTLNTHTAVQRALFRIWQSLETRGQIFKITSSSESSDEDNHLMLFCCWC